MTLKYELNLSRVNKMIGTFQIGGMREGIFFFFHIHGTFIRPLAEVESHTKLLSFERTFG